MAEDSNNLFYQFDLSRDSQPQESRPIVQLQKTTSKNQNLVQELNSLNKAKQRFRQFLEELGEVKRSPIRQDILVYCGDQKKSQKIIETYVRPESILKKMQMRIDKMQKTRRIKRNWGQEDLNILLWIISKYCDLHHYQDLEKDINDEDWSIIATYIPGVTPRACMFKWLSIKKVTLATFRWVETESSLLERIVIERMGDLGDEGVIKDWKQISQELYRLNEDKQKVYRNAKQCKEHWNCHLDPELKKGLWQLGEDIKLLKFIRDNKGLKKWSELARHFDGRTENAIKNRHKLIVQKLQKQAKNRHKEELQLISDYLQKLLVDQLTNHVRMDNQNYFESNSEEQMACQQIVCTSAPKAKAKKEELNQDTNDGAITPSRVEKFNIINFRNMDIHFLKNIQPGVMESGTFKKISENPSPPVERRQDSAGVKRQPFGPFTITPLHPSQKSLSW